MPSLDLAADETRYFSFLVRKEIAAASNNNLEFNLIDSANSGVNEFRFGATSADRFFLTSTDADDLGSSVTIGETYFVVMRVDANPGATPDVLSALIYSGAASVPLTEPLAWNLTYSIDSSVNLDTIRMRVGNSTAGSFDEFRIGETWADVSAVPEPAAAFLAVISCLMGGVGVRRVRNSKRVA
jgi:hypothetical protein